jgi:uncharacterized protein
MRGLLLLAGALAFCASALAQDSSDPIAVPKLTGRVVDLTGTLTAPEQSALEAKLRAFEQTKGSQVAVLLVPTIGNEAIEDFAGRVTDAWQLGRKGVDDGVLFVIAKQQRKMRIHNGRGVQGVMTDALSKRILAEIVSPAFRSGDFSGGINAGADAIIKAIEGEDLPVPTFRSSSGAKKVGVSLPGGDNFFMLAFFLVPIVAAVLRKLVGRLGAAGLTGAITGAAAWFIFSSLLVAGIAAVVASFFGLITGTAGGRRGRSNFDGWGTGGWSGGGGGGGWSGGGDSGGFSGGGGGFDGGGASGDW